MEIGQPNSEIYDFRLPIVQGGTFSFLPPTFAILSTFGKCPELLPHSKLC